VYECKKYEVSDEWRELHAEEFIIFHIIGKRYFIIIITIIIILGISFMQRINTHIPETNHVTKEYCVATILM
jgi:hypothetical protein